MADVDFETIDHHKTIVHARPDENFVSSQEQQFLKIKEGLEKPGAKPWKINDIVLKTPADQAPVHSPPRATAARATYNLEQWDKTNNVRYLVNGKTFARGGMSQVFLGCDLKLRKPVALKVSTLGDWPGMNPEHEAHIVANLPTSLSTGLVEVFDYLEVEVPNIFFRPNDSGAEVRKVIVMEYLDPEVFPTLRKLYHDNGNFKLSQVVEIITKLAPTIDGLAEAGVFNQDLTPGNIFWNHHSGEVKLSDFGISSPVDSDAGTPGFRSPEKARGGKVDIRSEVFSLAQLVHYLMTGVTPFIRLSGKELSPILTDMAIVNEPRDEISEMPQARKLNSQQMAALKRVDHILSWASAKDPRDRYPSVTEFASALKSAATGVDFRLGEVTTSTSRTNPQRTEVPPDLATQVRTRQSH